jgi:hypothetical protein
LPEVGLDPEPPFLWGSVVPCQDTGVYVVELPEALRKAPIDASLVASWLSFVGTITIDGQPASRSSLVARLSEFWLPSQRIIYVGRTSRPLRPRIGEYARTRLGKRSPHHGGSWVKTLSVLPDCTVWAAATDRYVEAEAELLQAFRRRVPDSEAQGLYDPTRVLPFANLEDEWKIPKLHGIRGAVAR